MNRRADDTPRTAAHFGLHPWDATARHQDFAGALERENAALHTALAELVRLKELGDRTTNCAGTAAEIEDYRTNKPKAWAAAGALVKQLQREGGS